MPLLSVGDIDANGVTATGHSDAASPHLVHAVATARGAVADAVANMRSPRPEAMWRQQWQRGPTAVVAAAAADVPYGDSGAAGPCAGKRGRHRDLHPTTKTKQCTPNRTHLYSSQQPLYTVHTECTLPANWSTAVHCRWSHITTSTRLTRSNALSLARSLPHVRTTSATLATIALGHAPLPREAATG